MTGERVHQKHYVLSAGLIDRPRGDNATHDHKNNERFDRIVLTKRSFVDEAKGGERAERE